MSFPRYPAYRDSGVEWLGEVPAHWSLPPLYTRYEAALGKMLDEKRITGSSLLPYVRNADVQWDHVNVNDLPEMDVEPHELERFTLRTGDLLVCEGGEVGRSAIWRGEISLCAFQKAIHRLRPINAREVPRYLYYVMHAAVAAGAFIAGSNPNTIPHLTSDKLRKYRLPSPPADEQAAISSFLDREVGVIDTSVAEYNFLIALLKEKRQAVISHGVTKGLDPHAPMKDSGVEWLGEVPAHWEVRRMKRISPQLTVGIVVEPSKYYADEGIPALRSLNVRQGEISSQNLVFLSAEANDLHAKSVLRAGDLVAVRSGQPGTAAVIPPEFDGCNCIDLIIIRKPREGSEWYLCWFLASAAAVAQFSMGSGGAIQQHFNVSTAADLLVPFPPPDEQHEIAKQLASDVHHMDAMIAEAERAIALLQERRTALILAAVTGKIDVRRMAEAAA